MWRSSFGGNVLCRFRAGIHFRASRFHQPAQTPHMIHIGVGNQNVLDVLRLLAQFPEHIQHDFGCAGNARIYQNTAIFNEKNITK